MIWSQLLKSFPKIYPRFLFICFDYVIWFHLGYRMYIQTYDMCKSCHSVKIEIFKSWNWLYRSLHSKVSNAVVETRILIVRTGQIKSYLWAQVSMLQDTHLCFHIYIYSVVLQVLGRSAPTPYTPSRTAAPRTHALCSIEWGALLPTLLRAHLPALVQGHRQDDDEDEDHEHHNYNDEEHSWKTKGTNQLQLGDLASHSSVGRTEGNNPKWHQINVLCNLKFFSSALSTATHFN